MSLDALRDRLPDYAKDLRLNLGTLATEPALTAQQRAGTFVAAALAARNPDVTQAVVAEFTSQLSADALNAARAAAAIMGMNNVYYRFTHVVGGDYASMPARLRMSVIGRPGVEKADFELWCLAVSAINGCEACMRSHEQAMRQAGLSQEQVQAAIRIAAVIHAAAVVMDGEAALATVPAQQAA